MVQQSKRDKILETATKLFMQNGFQSVSVDQIVAAVPVSKPTLYAHFKDKRELFAAVISERCERALATIKAEISNEQSATETLEAFGNNFLGLLFSKPALQFHRVMIGESESFPDMAKMFYETGPLKMHDLLEDYLSQMHKKKMLHVPDPSLSADIFIGMLKGRGHLKALLGIAKKEMGEDERKVLVKAAVGIFVRGQLPQG